MHFSSNIVKGIFTCIDLLDKTQCISNSIQTCFSQPVAIFSEASKVTWEGKLKVSRNLSGLSLKCVVFYLILLSSILSLRCIDMMGMIKNMLRRTVCTHWSEGVAARWLGVKPSSLDTEIWVETGASVQWHEEEWHFDWFLFFLTYP